MMTSRKAFSKQWPNDAGLLDLADNNREFSLDAIGARHRWVAFEKGWEAALASTTPAPIDSAKVEDTGEPVAWRAEVSRIVDDYQPDSASQAILALEEMRQALRELLERSEGCKCDAACQDNGEGNCRYAPPTPSTQAVGAYQVQCKACGHLDYYAAPTIPVTADDGESMRPVAWADGSGSFCSDAGKREGFDGDLFNIPLYGSPDMRDAYVGAREDLEIWKRRALEAEELNRKFMREINGPTHMGEPVIATRVTADDGEPEIVGPGDMSFEEAAERGRCTVPPAGWSCSREKGHDGSCAPTPSTQAVGESGVPKLWVHNTLERLRVTAPDVYPEQWSVYVPEATAPTTGSAPVAEVESWTNGSYHRNYKIKWLRDVAAGTKLYAAPASPAASVLSEDAILAIAIDHGLGTAVVESIVKDLLAASMGGEKA